MQKISLLTGILFALFSVIFGAFGAHKLKTILPPEGLASFETGVRYQFYHGLTLIVLYLLMMHFNNFWINTSPVLFISGILLFSFSIYFLSIFHFKWLGPITPLGGIFLILGWIFLLIGVVKK